MNRRSTHSHYQKHLKEVILQILTQSYDLDMTLDDLAKKAGVHYKTIYRIDSGITQLPRHRTIYLLADAVGLAITLVPYAVKMSKASAGKIRSGGRSKLREFGTKAG